MHSISTSSPAERGTHTWAEISQQMNLWPTTLERVNATVNRFNLRDVFSGARVLLTGAGTSFYAASAIAAAWSRSTAVASTDLLVDADRYLNDIDILISVGRSGDSPESMATVDRVQKVHPGIRHFAVTCNGSGALAQSSSVQAIVLDPRTEDKSLVMTSSFTNLVIAGLALADSPMVEEAVAGAARNAQLRFSQINEAVQRIAAAVTNRIVLLSSSPLYPWAQEGTLKVTEMAGGKFPVLAETYLGLRHGPMTFLQPDTVVLCLLSSQAERRNYELDLIRELNTKSLGHIFAIGSTPEENELFHDRVDAVAPTAPDELRTPFETIGPQLLGYHLSLLAGLNPDNPSPDGVINRVVQGVKIYSPSSL